MSVSKLESLPNEILIEIFEKYMNGVDILNGFAYSQNKRFDALICQCRRFYFNFYNCRKDYFHFCIDLLPTFYIDKIEELVLSDQNTPGQIHTFLSLFPSFMAFKRLRKLYFHLNDNSIDWSMTTRAIRSLPNTIIHTVFIEIINTNKKSTLNYAVNTSSIRPFLSPYTYSIEWDEMTHAGGTRVNDIIGLKTIKRLFLTSTVQHNQWFFLTNNSSKIEYLTNSGRSYGFQHLQYIFQRDSRLKYLSVQLTSQSYFGYYHLINLPNNNIISMLTLHTLILSFEQDEPTTFDMLAQYLKSMPVLHRLEIKAYNALLDANAWESLLQTSLPLLTHFRLKTTTSRIKINDIENILASFETPFWIEKKNFYLIITKHKHLSSNRFYLNNNYDEFNQPIIQWWIVPIRARIDDIPLNDIMSLGLFGIAQSLSQYYYFKNVKHLVIYNLDNNLLEWFLTYVNYLRIEYLDISFLDNESDTITLLLLSVKNITSLRIPYKRLLIHQNVYLKKDNSVKYLDISVNKHSFDKKDIIIISKLFPNLEHLAINTIELSNIPLLKIYLPHLCSLTLKIMDNQFLSYSNYQQKNWYDHLQEQVQFLFYRNDEWITIWIDQAALEDPYWQKCNSNVTTLSKRRFPFSE